MIQSNWGKSSMLMGLLIALAGLMMVALYMGQIPVPATSVLHDLAARFGWEVAWGESLTPEQNAVLWYIRLPRICVAILVGSALAIAGAVMQGVFGNPLADPGIIGVSAGASFGAVIAVSLGLTSAGMFYMPSFAFLGAFASVLLTISLTMRGGKIPTMSLLLAGVAVSMLLGALTSGILTFMNEYRLKEFLFWMVGGLDYRRWEHVYLAVGPILAGMSILCLLSRHLNVLVLGDIEAKALGLPVVWYRILFLGLASVVTATAVCVSGSIGFVGLIVPHIMRLLIGPDHRLLLPGSALAGALFLLFCDTLGRTIMPPTEIRVGIMTALLGAPYFLFLLRRMRRHGGAF